MHPGLLAVATYCDKEARRYESESKPDLAKQYWERAKTLREWAVGPKGNVGLKAGDTHGRLADMLLGLVGELDQLCTYPDPVIVQTDWILWQAFRAGYFAADPVLTYIVNHWINLSYENMGDGIEPDWEYWEGLAEEIVGYWGTQFLREFPRESPYVPPGTEADIIQWWKKGMRGLANHIRALPDPAATANRPTPEVEDQAVENPNIPDPEEDLVRALRGYQRPILVYLWKRGNVKRDELRKAVWRQKKIGDKAIDKAIERLNTNLYELKHSLTKVESNGGMYCLKHPQK